MTIGQDQAPQVQPGGAGLEGLQRATKTITGGQYQAIAIA